MEIEEFRNLTIEEICNYIVVMNKLVEKGIIKFDKEKAYVEFYADKCISHLEKQNIELQQRIDKGSDDLQNLINDINDKTIIGLNNLIPKLETIQDELVGGNSRW